MIKYIVSIKILFTVTTNSSVHGSLVFYKRMLVWIAHPHWVIICHFWANMFQTFRARGGTTPLIKEGADTLELFVVAMLSCTHSPTSTTFVMVAFPVVVPGTIIVGIAPVATLVLSFPRWSLTGPVLLHVLQTLINLQTKWSLMKYWSLIGFNQIGKNK